MPYTTKVHFIKGVVYLSGLYAIVSTGSSLFVTGLVLFTLYAIERDWV